MLFNNSENLKYNLLLPQYLKQSPLILFHASLYIIYIELEYLKLFFKSHG